MLYEMLSGWGNLRIEKDNNVATSNEKQERVLFFLGLPTMTRTQVWEGEREIGEMGLLGCFVLEFY